MLPDPTLPASRADGGARAPVSAGAPLYSRRIWLPSPLYAAIPWIYLVSGTLSLLGALYLPDWAWPLPYAALFGIACLHAGLRIATMRRKSRGSATAWEAAG
jgi:hypothetical protein